MKEKSRSQLDDNEERWRQRFSMFGREYAEDHLVSGWSRAGLERRLDLFSGLIRDVLPRNSLVLDLGCGAGTYTRFLASLGHRVVAMDYSLPSLQRAHSADPDGLADYIVADGYKLPFGGECFDAVVTIGVLQVLAHPEQVLAEICRIMRPGALLVLEFLNALEVVSAITRLIQRLGGVPPRVRSFSPNLMRANLFACGYDVHNRVGVYLPPRNVPWFGQILERKKILSLLESIPGLSLLTAHAFILASIKRPVSFLPIGHTGLPTTR